MIPKLRFKGFSGEWNSHQLGDIASFQKGKGISKADIDAEGSYKCIRYGELYTEYNEVIDTVVSKTNQPITESVVSEKGDVLIPASGETAIDMATACSLQFDDIILGGDINVIRPAKKTYSELIAYSLSHSKRKQLARVAQGNSVVHIYGKHLSTLQIELPNTEEEVFVINKILKVVNTKINLLTKKKEALETYKKGLMQKIFSQELRFKREDGTDYPEWVSTKIGNHTFKVSEKNKNSESLPIYSITNKGGFVPQSEQFEGVDSSERGYDISMYKIVGKNTFAYNPARINVGSFGYSANLDRVQISSLYVCFKVKPNLSPIYLLQFMSSFKFNKSVLRNVEGGVRQYLFYDNFKNIRIPLPSLNEQEKIVQALILLDENLASLENAINKTQEFKKGLLQQMFV